MKIILLGTTYPYRGGLATFNERLARQFQEEGHEVELWTFTLQYPSFLFPGKTQYSSEQPPAGLAIRRVLNSCNPFNWLRVGRQIRKAAPDMLICCYWMAFFAPAYGLISRMARRNGKTKTIALVHNMMPHEPSILDKLFAPYFVASQDGFIALSESVVKDIEKVEQKIINHKSQIINTPKAFSPHPIYDHYGPREPRETALQRLGLDEGYRYLLFFGLVRAYKGLDWLIEAFADERLAAYPLKLIVAGEFYDDKAPYLEKIQSLGLQDRIIVDDRFVPDGQVKDYFNAADIVVQPYKSATQSGVTQVAYHFEKPMLVTNVGGLDEIVPNGKVGYAVNPDPKSIADALVDFFANQREAEFIANIAVEKQKYSWSRMSTTIKNVLK